MKRRPVRTVRRALLALAMAACGPIAPAVGQTADVETADVETRADARTGLSLTIYNQDLALVRDARRIDLEAGTVRLDFTDVSAQIRPETALLAGNRLRLIEQNFDFDLMSPAKLFEKAVGERVRLYRIHPTSGQDLVEEARVLSANGGIVLEVGDRIEVLQGSQLPGRVVFDRIPANLRARPTLSMLLDVTGSGARDVELTYLTGGLSWRADYVGTLNDAEDRLALQGWVTLTNRSGTAYRQATTQLVAGSVNIVRDEVEQFRRRPAPVALAEAADVVKEEGLLDYHLYTLPRPTTVADNQTKQVGFLTAPQVRVAKRYLYESVYFGTSNTPENATVHVTFTNDDDSGLGLPLPKGIVRLYKNDSAGRSQFVGEDRIDHTPDGTEVKLAVGRAFDVTIEKRLISSDTIARSRDRQVVETGQEFIVRNAKDTPVTVRIEQRLYGDWTILEESQRHQPVDAERLAWDVSVRPKGETRLAFRVRIEQ